jgi:predicted DNA-binding transcriptional regulator AlpA
MPEPLWGPEELSEFLGDIPLDTLYYWRHRGEGPPALKVGRHLRYRPEDVRRWLDSRVETR